MGVGKQGEASKKARKQARNRKTKLILTCDLRPAYPSPLGRVPIVGAVEYLLRSLLYSFQFPAIKLKRLEVQEDDSFGVLPSICKFR